MTALMLVLVMASESCSIAGQILFKLAMGEKWDKSRRAASFILLAGVAAMALGFFLWLGLLSKVDLSLLYPFEGMNRLILMFAAVVFLKEKIEPRLWLGVLLISAGVTVVALT